MQIEEDELSRPETLLAAVISLHPGAAPVVRDMCAALVGSWSSEADPFRQAQVH
jgi:hypothetical protein